LLFERFKARSNGDGKIIVVNRKYEETIAGYRAYRGNESEMPSKKPGRRPCGLLNQGRGYSFKGGRFFKYFDFFTLLILNSSAFPILTAGR
jgi:hypothetical protein